MKELDYTEQNAPNDGGLLKSTDEHTSFKSLIRMTHDQENRRVILRRAKEAKRAEENMLQKEARHSSKSESDTSSDEGVDTEESYNQKDLNLYYYELTVAPGKRDNALCFVPLSDDDLQLAKYMKVTNRHCWEIDENANLKRSCSHLLLDMGRPGNYTVHSWADSKTDEIIWTTICSEKTLSDSQHFSKYYGNSLVFRSDSVLTTTGKILVADVWTLYSQNRSLLDNAIKASRHKKPSTGKVTNDPKELTEGVDLGESNYGSNYATPNHLNANATPMNTTTDSFFANDSFTLRPCLININEDKTINYCKIIHRIYPLSLTVEELKVLREAQKRNYIAYKTIIPDRPYDELVQQIQTTCVYCLGIIVVAIIIMYCLFLTR